MYDIDSYRPIVGDAVIHELQMLGAKLDGRVVQHINSTAVGGGVAEILTRMVPLSRQLGVNAIWDVIKGNGRFYSITKKMHNALPGVKEEITNDDLEFFLSVNRENAREMAPKGDIVFIHDPQPIGLREAWGGTGRKWIWRCHIDFTNPDPRVFEFLKRRIETFDSAVFSAPAFARKLSIPQVLIAPSIDPLSDKNRDLEPSVVEGMVKRFGLDPARPIVTQISRFDYLKDPVGVVKVYKRVKKSIDIQLVLAGGGATDDPEGARVLEDVTCEAAGDPDIHVILLPVGSDIEINALQRASAVVLQKSLKEGFGLTVAEALWKEKPVIASAVGGIPLQIIHGNSGILTHTIEGTAHYLKMLLNEPDYASRLGKNGKEHVRNNFLITRHLRDYLLLFHSLYHVGDMVRL